MKPHDRHRLLVVVASLALAAPALAAAPSARPEPARNTLRLFLGGGVGTMTSAPVSGWHAAGTGLTIRLGAGLTHYFGRNLGVGLELSHTATVTANPRYASATASTETATAAPVVAALRFPGTHFDLVLNAGLGPALAYLPEFDGACGTGGTGGLGCGTVGLGAVALGRVAVQVPVAPRRRFVVAATWHRTMVSGAGGSTADDALALDLGVAWSL